MSKDGEINLVSSRVYPGLERSPGDRDNWVERTGGLPSYIERIAKHLHYEQGMTISRSIAVAVNTVKRWAKGGTVTSHGTTKRITPKTQALAIKAVAEWEAKKARARATNLAVEDMTRAQKEALIDLALTKDGRKSFKRQGKWGHGFVPLDAAAKRAKAKGSPIAMRRMNRLYGGKTRPSDLKGTLKVSKGGSSERTSTGRAASARRAKVTDSTTTQRYRGQHQSEHSKGGGKVSRSNKPWDEIAEKDKVTRNGKRYVRSVYRGVEQLVEWSGENPGQSAPDPSRRVLQSIRTVDAQRMTTAQIRRLLKTPGQTAAAKKTLSKVLRAKIKEAK